jgi:phosphotransferase system enzyme I (PtsI)
LPRRRSKVYEGIAASPGIHVGLVYLIDRRRMRIPKVHLPDEQLDGEEQRFLAAVDKGVSQLEAILARLQRGGRKEPMGIIEAHLMMMRDQMLVQETLAKIRKESINAEWALQQTVVGIRKLFDAIEDDYFRERRSDVEFVGDRLLRNLLGQDTDLGPPPHDRAVVVARDLSPADTAGLGRESVGAFVVEMGSKTSHTAIVARALERPAVLGVEGILERVGTGDRIIVDGYRGQVIVDPSENRVREALARSQGLRLRAAELASQFAEPAETIDGRRMVLSANIEMVEDVEAAKRYGAEGVGLLRTEFLFMGRRAPSEGSQLRCYQRVLRGVAPHSATIRTMDLGGDKSQDLFSVGSEPNPALGLRSIRLSLRHRGMFLTQLRALLRASVSGKLRLLFPMISCQKELHEALAALEEARQQLRDKGQPFDESIEVGIMIEVPSAAFLSLEFARQVSFFSIGTNDLIQYLLAVDRHNEQVAYLYNPLHLSVLRLLRQVIQDGHKAGIRVSMCGEMAGNPEFIHILLGLDLDEISMNPLALPYARHLIRHSRQKEAKRLVRQVMRMGDSESIREAVRGWMAQHFPDFFSLDGPSDILGGL